MRFELVIFDCDGVLVDSELLSNRILAERLTAAGLPTTTEDSVRDYMGRSLNSALVEVEKRLGRALPAGFADAYYEETFAAFARELEPVAGIHAALDAIGLPSCVASSGPHEKIRHSLGLTGLLERFEGRIFSAADVGHGKPAPDLFLHAAETIGVPPGRCVVVEDAPAGVQGGRAAGMTVLGYAGLTDGELLRAEGATVFTDMAELPALISPDPPIPEPSTDDRRIRASGSAPRSAAGRST
jgi:HAD superfamily hydrolase (TIGR01509 family)